MTFIEHSIPLPKLLCLKINRSIISIIPGTWRKDHVRGRQGSGNGSNNKAKERRMFEAVICIIPSARGRGKGLTTAGSRRGRGRGRARRRGSAPGRARGRPSTPGQASGAGAGSSTTTWRGEHSSW